MGMSLHGSMDGRREDFPDPLRSDARRSEGLRLDIYSGARYEMDNGMEDGRSDKG